MEMAKQVDSKQIKQRVRITQRQWRQFAGKGRPDFPDRARYMTGNTGKRFLQSRRQKTVGPGIDVKADYTVEKGKLINEVM